MTVRTLASLFVMVLALSAPGWTQQEKRQPGKSPGEILAVLDGVEYTARDIEKLRSYLPANLAPQLARMSHRNFLEMMRSLMGVAKTAEREGLLEKEPYKTQFNFMRWNALANAYTTNLNRTLTVSEEDILADYEASKAIYSAVQVSGIYIDYVPASGAAAGGNGLSEDQAREKAEGLVVELNGGADFAALAREHSDDKSSAEKGGDLGLFSGESPLPNVVKNAILTLPVGDISSPVKDGGRFYIFKATDRRPRPLVEVREQIESKLRGTKVVQEARQAQTAVSLEFKESPELDKPPQGPSAGGSPGR
ncbi:MAG: peptidylprolyl isomerase [Acidobacteria bacterium]|nr:peptidylprolyl isomerase [Acidobacteriota bacterium]